jgi:hypothetical protein
MDIDITLYVMHVCCCFSVAGAYFYLRYNRNPYHTSKMSGADYCRELLLDAVDDRFYEINRMDKIRFMLLSDLVKHYGLKDGKKISVEEKLMIFIHLLRGLTFRTTAERFQHSIATIHDVLNECISTFNKMKDILYVKPDTNRTPEYIQSKVGRFYPYFSNCIGALDGSHIPANVPLEDQSSFRNRKGFLSQNILAVVNFDMTIQYVLTGWEGSAHDGKVLLHALDTDFVIPNNRFYLGDAGYALTSYCLTPYRGVRYHLKEWRNSNEGPSNKEELFNLRHSSLRNVVERTFGVVKKRFGLLCTMNDHHLV